MSVRCLVVVLVALFATLQSVAIAADQVSKLDAAASAAEAKGAERNATPTDDANAEGRLALPSAPSSVLLADAATRQAYLDSMQRYYAYRGTGYVYRSRVFEWQLVSGRIIFAVVLMVVLSGLIFAAVQFYVSMMMAKARLRAAEERSEEAKRRSEGTASGQASTESVHTEGIHPLATKLQVSGAGIVVESSVLGVVILTLSLVFFYLYLVYVYPVVNVF